LIGEHDETAALARRQTLRAKLPKPNMRPRRVISRELALRKVDGSDIFASSEIQLDSGG
jgi:hypothetical protein